MAFSTILTLLLGEASLRICHWANPSFIFYSCSYNRFRGRPFSDKYGYRLNSKGFNDTECEARKPAGTLRVLGIGDSFAFGVVPYANNYLTLLEEELRARGKKVEIVNMGIPCIGPEEYLSVLASEGLDLDPDMVLVSFFVGNDFETPQPRPAWSYSYLYSFADFGRKYLGQMIHGDGQYQDDRPSMTDDTYLQIECVRSLVFKVKDQGFARAFPGAVHPLLDMKRICDRRGICFCVAIIPDELQVDRQLQRRVEESLHAEPSEFDFALPNRALRERLEASGVDYVDLLEPFASTSSDERVYKPNDSHWNIAGNRLAAKRIGEAILPRLPR